MPRITISKQTLDHVRAFLALGEQLCDEQGEEATLDLCAETLILLGIRAVLDGLWRPQEPDIHVQTLHLLAAAYPHQVLPFLAHIMREGGKAMRELEEQEAPFGFRPQQPSPPAAPSL